MSNIDDLAAAFAQQSMNAWSGQELPQEPMARAFVTHGAIMTAAIVGAKQCAAELREMADQLELGASPVAGHG
ncbi:hypothetical protein LQG66_27260 [Bradyrhizobium ontarionense]|uniref:Uncharacterized protein n=1 Tax=Bradyrhizobium ontarionense TaxID=2898149 RepID=A0ABY3R6Y5_9BRAD|nr:hypothetical protein [Bradyrhizobium sp. A19]UFZ02929.1 hypothetical protein LQG66_27260 [Bradyrhizobium sp. A19]